VSDALIVEKGDLQHGLNKQINALADEIKKPAINQEKKRNRMKRTKENN